MSRSSLFVILLLATTAACQTTEGTTTDAASSAAASASAPQAQAAPAEAQGHVAFAKRAQAMLMPFKQSLKKELMAGLAKSPVDAVSVCSERAPQLAKEASRDGVEVGRSALKLRNSDNKAPAWLDPPMERLAKIEKPAGDEPVYEVVDLPDGRTGYVEAIWVGGPCLICHGESVGPDVAAAIANKYPDDAATGFKTGDFRGVFYATMKANP